jgi:hypothetical protein
MSKPQEKKRCKAMVIDPITRRERRCKHIFLSVDPDEIYCFHHTSNVEMQEGIFQQGTFQQEDYTRIALQDRIENTDEYHKLMRFIVHFSDHAVQPAIYYEDNNKIKVDIPLVVNPLVNPQFLESLYNLTLNQLRLQLKMRGINVPVRPTKESLVKLAFSSKFNIKSLLNPGVNGLPNWDKLNLNFAKWCEDTPCQTKIEFNVSSNVTPPKLHLDIEKAVNDFDARKITISETPLYFILSGGGHAHILFLLNGKFYNMGLGSAGSKGKLLAFSPDIANYMTEHMQIVDIGILNQEHLNGINAILGKASSIRFDIGESISQSITISDLYYNLCSRTSTYKIGEVMYKFGELVPLPVRKATRVCSKMALNCTTFLTRIFKNINCDEHLIEELAEVKRPLRFLKRIAPKLPESIASPGWCTRAKTRTGKDNLLTADVLDTIFHIIFVNDNEYFKNLIDTGIITNESTIDWRLEFPPAKFHPTGFSAANML